MNKTKFMLIVSSSLFLSLYGCSSNSTSDFTEKNYKTAVEKHSKFQTEKPNESVDYSYEKKIKEVAKELQRGNRNTYIAVIKDLDSYASKNPVSLSSIESFKRETILKASSKEYLEKLPEKSYEQLLSDYYLAHLVELHYEPDYVNSIERTEFKTAIGFIARYYSEIITHVIAGKSKLSYDAIFDTSYQDSLKKLNKYSKPYAEDYLNSEVKPREVEDWITQEDEK